MPDNRLTITIEAQNLAQAAFKQFQTDVRQSNEALQKAGQAGRQSSAGIKVVRDELGRFHNVATGRFVSAARLLKEGFTEAERGARGASRGLGLLQRDIQATVSVVRQFSRALTSQTRAIIQEAAQIERLRLGLNTLSPSIAEADAQYRRLIEVARLPGIDFSNALRASLQLQAIGKSGEEATRILIAFGNSLALSGASTADIQRTIYGLRQLIADGKVYQRELNLITSRVPIATPILQDRFGGVRADDIRSHFESIGVDESQQAAEFIKILTEELEKLPRASETAANALENIGDTSRRVQGAIGENLLPAVKETAAAIEGLLFSVEGDEGLKTATADALAFATAMGGVSAGILGVAAVIPLLAGLAGPIGIAALGAGALAGAFVQAEVQAARFREEVNRTQSALQGALQIGRGEDSTAIQGQIERLEARRTALQNQIRTAEEAAQAEADRQPELRRGEPNPYRQTAEQILGASSAYETYQNQLFQTNKAIEVLTRRTNSLGEAQEAVATTAGDTVTRAFQSLTDAASGTDAQIAEALQQFENANVGSDDQATADLAIDIGSQLVSIAEATSVAQIDASKRRVDALARDNSLILEDSKQLQALLLAGEEAFAARRRQFSQDALTLEVHDEGAQALREALLRFYDLQSTVQEDAGIDARQSAEQQATAYIRAYRDSIDPAILNLVESVKLLREEVRGSIQDLETLNLQDKLRIELNEENLSPVADFFTELVDLQQAAQGDLTRSQIDSLEKRSQALRQYLSDDTANFVAYASDIEAIDETLTDKSLSLLEGAVQAREALFRDEARTQRQVEQAKRQENEKTYDFDVFLAGLRTKSRHAASQDLIRLEERALDATSSRQLEALTRDTQQFVDMYSERGEAFRDLVADATALGNELQQAFDLTEQQKRLEDFQDSVAGVLDNLAGIAIDHIFDGFFGAADEATTAIQTFTDVFRGDIELLENDVTRLTRQVEDSKIRLLRLDEDGERRIRQLERQRRSVLARGSTGNQRDAERTRQRAQDISFRISDLREDFDVRRRRTQEDADLRRNRAIADAEGQRDRALARQEGDSLLSEIQASLTDATVNALSSAIASGLGSLLSSPLEKIAGFLAGGLVSSLGDLFGGLFGGDGDGDGDGTGGTTALDGTLTIDKEDIALPEGALDLTGQITLALTDITAPVEAVDVTGRISAIDELSESVKLPPVPGLTGGIGRLVLPPGVDKPIVPGLTGEIARIQLAEGLTLPTLPALHVPIIYDVPELPEGRVEVGELEPVSPPGETPARPSEEGITGTINAELNRLFDEPVQIPGVINAELNRAFTEPVEVQGQIVSVALAAALSEIDLVGRVNAEVNVLTPQPIVLPGIINARVNQPPLREGHVEVGELVPVGPPGEIPANDNLVRGLTGIIEDVQLSPDIDLPTIPLTAVVDEVGGGRPRGSVLSGSTDREDEDPENPQLDIGDLAGEIDALSISEDAKALLEPVQLDGEINATLVKLFSEPVLIDGIINARINYGTGANIEQGGGGGGGEGQTAPGGGQQAPNIGDFNPQTPGEQPEQGFNLNPQGGLVANRNGGGGGGGGGNAIQVTFPPSLRNAITDQAGTLKEIQASQKEFFQSSIAFFDNAGARGLTANQHLAGIRRALLSEDAPQVQLSTEATLVGMAETLKQIRFATERVADAPLVDRLVDAGVGFPNDPTDPTNAALTQSPIVDILGQGGLSLLSSFDAIAQNLEILQGGAANAQPADLSQMPGSTPDNPVYIIDTSRPPVQKVEVMNTVKTETKVMNDVNVKQVGVVQVSQSGEWVMQLAGGGTLPVYVQGGRLVADIAGGLEGLAVNLADTEVGLRAVGAI